MDEKVKMEDFLQEEKCHPYSLWKFVAENHTENFATLKITLKNNIKEGFTENYTEQRPFYSGKQKKKKVNSSHFYSN